MPTRYQLALLLIALCACTNRDGVHPHHLRIANGQGDVPTLNSHLYSGGTLADISQLSQGYLIRYDSQRHPYPELLTVIPTHENGGISGDGKTIVWHLRKGVRWSDGVAFTADDLVFSTRAVLNPANNELGRDGFDLIDGLGEPDKYSVVYHLRHPYAEYESTFFGSDGGPSILPIHLLGHLPNINNAPYNSKPIGLGPFRVVLWKRGESVELERNPFYFRGRPKLDGITYKLIATYDTVVTELMTREVDLWPGVSPMYLARIKNLEGLRIVTAGLGTDATVLGLNVVRPLLTDAEVRRAIRYAINRRRILTKIAHGYGALQESPVSEKLPLAPKGIPFAPYDPAYAKRILDRAGWRMAADGVRVKNGKRLSLRFAFSNGASTLGEMAELIRNDLINVGIEVQLRTYPSDRLFGGYADGGILANTNWDLGLYRNEFGVFMSDFFECDRIPPGGGNFSHYCNSGLDRLFDETKQTYDERRQLALIDREVRIIVRDVPLIVLYMNGSAYVSSRDLSGFKNSFDDPLDWDI